MPDTIASLNNVELLFPWQGYHPKSLREEFVGRVMNPLGPRRKESTDRVIVKNLSVTIKRGERIALLGANGAGKTSLCRLIGGLLPPSSGTMNVTQDTRAIFHSSPLLFPDLSGRDNAELALDLIFPILDRKEKRALLKEVIEFSELKEQIHARYRTFSTGMQTRLMLSLVTCRPAELLILDEVFDGADIFWREKAAKRTETLIEQSSALLFVSHSPELIKHVCRSAWVLVDEKITVFESVDEGLKYYLERASK